MSAREVVESFWAAMTANDWDAAAALFADDATVDWLVEPDPGLP